MIGQYLSNKNKSATVSKSKKFLHLNKPFVQLTGLARKLQYETQLFYLFYGRKKERLFRPKILDFFIE
jgi:hypothetical protein